MGFQGRRPHGIAGRGGHFLRPVLSIYLPAFLYPESVRSDNKLYDPVWRLFLSGVSKLSDRSAGRHFFRAERPLSEAGPDVEPLQQAIHARAGAEVVPGLHTD